MTTLASVLMAQRGYASKHFEDACDQYDTMVASYARGDRAFQKTREHALRSFRNAKAAYLNSRRSPGDCQVQITTCRHMISELTGADEETQAGDTDNED